MLYARAALNARGLVHFGLRHIRKYVFRRAVEVDVLTCEDALNRLPLHHLGRDSEGVGNSVDNGERSKSLDSTTRVMMYIFPRQFALHNVFTSHVDPMQTAQRFQDYTLREEEIVRNFRKSDGCTEVLDVHVPKRLRGKLEYLVQRLQTLHARCSYAALLQHYCPVRFNALVRLICLKLTYLGPLANAEQ